MEVDIYNQWMRYLYKYLYNLTRLATMRCCGGTVELLVDSRMDGGRMGDPDHTAL